MILIALSIPFWILSLLFRIELLPGLPLSALSFVVPFIAGSIFLKIEDRKYNVRNTLSELLDISRIKIKHLIIVAIIMPTIFFVVFTQSFLSNNIADIENINGIKIIPLLVIFFIGALGEEYLWTGVYIKYVKPEKYLLGAIAIAFAYLVWHLIPFIQTGKPVDWIIGQMLFSFSFRVFIVQLFLKFKKTMITAIIVHSTYNLAWQIYPNSGSYYDPWKTFILMMSVVVIFGVVNKRRLTTAST